MEKTYSENLSHPFVFRYRNLGSLWCGLMQAIHGSNSEQFDDQKCVYFVIWWCHWVLKFNQPSLQFNLMVLCKRKFMAGNLLSFPGHSSCAFFQLCFSHDSPIINYKFVCFSKNFQHARSLKFDGHTKIVCCGPTNGHKLKYYSKVLFLNEKSFRIRHMHGWH